MEVARNLAQAADVGRTERVLVAEDNAVNRRVALSQLSRLGYTADAVSNGIEALEALRRVSYDIVFMDCQMPELDGFEATAAIRQAEGRNEHLWIIAMTASTSPSDREECRAAGMDDYLSKPVRLQEISAALDRAPRRKAPAPAIDSRSIDQLRGLPDEGEESLLKDLVAEFTQDAGRAISELRNCVARSEPRGVALAAHSLKGSSSYFGAHRLQTLCGEMESAGKTGRADVFPNLLVPIESELHRVMEALNRVIELQAV